MVAIISPNNVLQLAKLSGWIIAPLIAVLAQLSIEKVLPYKCRCGGVLKKSQTAVEFFGVDFGIRDCEVCTRCGSEFLADETLVEVEAEVKKRKLFGLEKQAQVTKSGNSLVIRIPPDLAKFLGLHYKDLVRLYPEGKSRLAIELSS